MTNKEFFTAHLHKEMKRTLNAVRALKEDMSALNFKHDEKSRSALQIIGHILPHPEAMYHAIDSKDILEEDKIFATTKEAHDYHENWTNKLIEKMKTVSDEQWDNDLVSLSVPSRKNIYNGPMREMFWSLLFDTIHHRGQLSTYYRQIGLRPPSIYGPTAEDREDMKAAATK